MVPRTFPSTYASNGQQQMLVHFLTDVTGLQRWLDYIPVKLSQGGTENSYDNDGYIDIAVTPITSVSVPYKDYVPVYADDEASDAWQVSSVGYIPYGYALFSDASMIQDFTTGAALDPRITFSRASNATMTGPDGTLQYAPHNLLTHSEQFDNAAWNKIAATLTANVSTAPDGTTTADKLIPSAVAQQHYLGRTGITGAAHTLSIFAKADGYSTVTLFFSVHNAYVTFDVSAGTITETSGTVTGTITSVGNGWYRLSASTSLTTHGEVRYFVINGSTYADRTVAGDGTSGALLWGAQLNVGALQPYYPTTVKNLLGFTQEFDNAAWSKIRASITANVAVDPQGYMTADKLVIDTTASNTHQVFQNQSITSGTTYTWSVYAKAAEINQINLRFSAQFPAGNTTFDLISGTKTNFGTVVDSTITDVGNGWYRCVFTQTANATGIASAQIFLAVSSSILITTANGTSGIFIWGAQLSDSASLDEYVYNPGAAPTAAAYYGPRFDYDPVTLAPKGLLIEEQRTNSIRNNTMQGAVAGTPGTSPTLWPVSSSGNGITREIVELGSESGVTYIDVRFFGTPTAGNNVAVAFEAANAIAAASGQTWTGSTYIALVDGSLSGITITFSLLETNGSGGVVDNSKVITPTAGALFSKRDSLTATLSGGGTVTNIQPRIRIGYTVGTPIDFTLRIGMPQLELGAFATSVIPTTTAAATRAADVAVMTGANFSNWYNQSEGTIYVEADMYETQFGFFRNPLALNDASGSSVNTVVFTVPSNSSFLRFVVNSAGVTSASLQQSLTLGSAFKAAGAYKLDDFAVSFNAGTPLTDTSGNTPVGVNTLVFGNTSHTLGVATHCSTHYKRIAYFPRRLSNAELQALTS
jgi:hypothetical protein